MKLTILIQIVIVIIIIQPPCNSKIIAEVIFFFNELNVRFNLGCEKEKKMSSFYDTSFRSEHLTFAITRNHTLNLFLSERF